MEGSITLNDEKLTRASRRKIAYVTQSDIFFENLTVSEHLLYSALLYLSGTHTSEEIIQVVDRVLAELHIDYIKQYQLKVLSGGQRKRCSIGAYLVSMPEILVLDGLLYLSHPAVYSLSLCLHRTDVWPRLELHVESLGESQSSN
jgi:ABC-type multidrug transport system ATPase subunit